MFVVISGLTVPSKRWAKDFSTESNLHKSSGYNAPYSLSHEVVANQIALMTLTLLKGLFLSWHCMAFKSMRTIPAFRSEVKSVMGRWSFGFSHGLPSATGGITSTENFGP
jgi:hypothetical protein